MLSISLIVSVLIISFCAIEFEICITRIFSLIFSYYYVFLALSVAMCGLGIGGFLATKKRYQKDNLPTISFLLAISYPLTISIALKFNFLLSHPLLLALCAIFPFILTGLFISLIFRFFHPFSGIIYLADLVGAALGALLIIVVLGMFSPINAIFFFALIILFSTFLFFRRWYQIPVILAILLFVCLNKDHTLLDIPYKDIAQIRDIKELVRVLSNKDFEVRIEKTYWNPSFRTDVVNQPFFGNRRQIFIDGSTPTIMLGFNGKLNSLSSLKRSINYFPFLIANKDTTLSIGPGGGLDVLLGLLAGFEKIEAVEINRDILKVLKDYEKFNGNILKLKGVKFIVGEGRGYLKRYDKKYDLIYLALAQTATASRVGLPLVESYLHTVDAYVDYLSHLKPKGLVAFICQQDFFLKRTVFNSLLALKDLGIDIKQANNHMIITSNPIPRSPYKYLLLLRKTPFDLAEVEGIKKSAEATGLVLEYLPYLYPRLDVEYTAVKEIYEEVEATKQNQGIDLSPTFDEKPFFYDLAPNAPPFLYWICISILIAGVFFALSAKNKKSLGFLTYFFFLGAGFMLVEIPLIQKFIFLLGYPTTTFSVILFSLLLGCGIGGFLTQRIKETRRVLPYVMALICLLLILLFLFMHNIMLSFFTLDNLPKIIVSCAIIFPLGVLLGMPFPFGMRRLGQVFAQDAGLMWGVNGLMSVFGGCLAMIIARNFGYRYSFLLASGIYIIILILSLRLFKE